MKKLFNSMILLLFAMLLWQCGADSSQFSAEMTRELSRLPVQNGNTGLAYINVKMLRESDFYDMVNDSINAHLGHQRDFQEFLSQTGFDFRNDVDEIYAVFDPGNRRFDHSALLVAIGNFQPEKITGYINQKAPEGKLVSESYGDFRLLRPEGGENVFCFANESHAVFGTENRVKAWLDKLDSGENAGIDSNLRERLSEIKFKNGMWVTVNAEKMVDKLMDQIPDTPDKRYFQPLQSVEQVFFSAKVDDAIRVDGAGLFSDAKNAGLFRDALKGALAAFKLSLSYDREAVDIVNKVNIETYKRKIRVNVEVTKREIEKMIRRHQGLAVR